MMMKEDSLFKGKRYYVNSLLKDPSNGGALRHCCLAPCKSVPNYGPLTEPKIYIVKFGRTAISTLNGRISETKRDFLDPLVPKFSYDRGLSPTLS